MKLTKTIFCVILIAIHFCSEKVIKMLNKVDNPSVKGQGSIMDEIELRCSIHSVFGLMIYETCGVTLSCYRSRPLLLTNPSTVSYFFYTFHRFVDSNFLL